MAHTHPAILLYCSSQSWGGLEMNVVRFARKFNERGYETVICCLAESEIAKHCKMRNLNTIVIERNKRYYDLIKAKSFSKSIQNYSPTVLWVNDPRDLDFCTWIKRFSKKPLRLVYNQGMQFSKAKKSLFHNFRFKAIDAWIAPLPYLKKQVESLTNLPSTRIHEIPRGVAQNRVNTQLSKEQARELLELPKENKILGVIGRLDKLKGQDTAIRALKLIDCTNTHLLIMGEETRNEGINYKEYLTELVQQLDLDRQVHFRNFSDSVGIFYSSIDICIVPSHAETIGMTTVEAMLAGLPIIGTNASGTPELLQHGKLGHLFTPSQEEELAEVLKAAQSDNEETKRKASLAKKYALKHYELEKVIDAYEAMLSPLF